MNINLPDDIIKGYLSGNKKESKYIKAVIKRIDEGEHHYFQISLNTKTQVFHKNYDNQTIKDALLVLFDKEFMIMELTTLEYIYSYKITSKGKLLTNKRKNKEDFIKIEHNKTKQYILTEGMIIPPLIDLGVMTSQGKIVKAKYDKFKQINRFLEIINDSISNEKTLKIIDFGCGKSYLTFILYYFLVEIKKMNCEIIGLDLKKEVIEHCNQIAEKYQYHHLRFYEGDISTFKEKQNIDMIVTLHACDTATDYALYYAIQMKCKYIFSVPCCHHEINLQLDSSYYHLVNKFGILKERFSSLLTDAIRANILQYYGYKTQIMEFVSIDNSPKNLLIRAVYTGQAPSSLIKKELEEQMSLLQVKQTLYNLLIENKDLD